MLESLPVGAEVTAAALGLLVAILGLIARSIARSEKTPHDPLRAEIAALVARLDQSDRQHAQRVQSLSENVMRELRNAEAENRRQFERLIDRLDRGRDHPG